MEYREIISDLVKQREARGWSRPVLAAKLGVSKQVLGNWENIRNRATIEDLRAWAKALDHQIFFSLAPAEAPPEPGELQAAISGMDAEKLRWVVDFANTLPRLDARDYRLLTDFVAAMRDSLSEESNS